MILKLFLKKIRYVKIERGFLEEQIVALRAELEKCKNTGSQPITPSPVPASPDHTGLGDFFLKAKIDWRTIIIYQDVQAAAEKLIS